MAIKLNQVKSKVKLRSDSSGSAIDTRAKYQVMINSGVIHLLITNKIILFRHIKDIFYQKD